jgi:hypothetical protein
MIGIVITMYDEADIVVNTINNCRGKDVFFVVVHSDNGERGRNIDFIKNHAEYVRLPNLGKELDVNEIGSAAICRNYNVGFNRLYQEGVFDYVIGMTGDTLIRDLDRVLAITNTGHTGYVLQAKGQYFYAKDDVPPCRPTRIQGPNTPDIMPQFFVFDGAFACEHRLFTRIVNANPYTSEENLGVEILRAVGDGFSEKIKRIHENPDVYDYHDGIRFQLKGLGHTRRL